MYQVPSIQQHKNAAYESASTTAACSHFLCKPHLPRIQPMNWSPVNSRILNFWLDHLRGNPNADSMVAVFDFDNTCIFGDIGQALFRIQVAGLFFRLTPGQLQTILPDPVETIGDKPGHQVQQRLLELYTSLWPSIRTNQQRKILHHPEAIELQALLSWYCTQARGHKALGARFTLQFMTQLLAGHTVEELEEFTTQVVSTVLAEPISSERHLFECGHSLGTIEVQESTGLQVHPEMIDLMVQLQRCGFKCCIVSASTQWVVEVAANQLGFPVTRENIYGIRVELKDDSLLTVNQLKGYPLTYRTGKVQIIANCIQAKPVFIAGDAVTDYEMLNMPDVPMRLLINHNRSGLISSLYQDPRFLLQGLHKGEGRFHPHRKTIESNTDIFFDPHTFDPYRMVV